MRLLLRLSDSGLPTFLRRFNNSTLKAFRPFPITALSIVLPILQMSCVVSLAPGWTDGLYIPGNRPVAHLPAAIVKNN